ncbi:MAG: hypothetical protein FD180_1817 [Planctomycetota bacterium]|nr:MAG: hypothetical protein FD180_1817 [Planctomycetota bacterium]
MERSNDEVNEYNRRAGERSREQTLETHLKDVLTPPEVGQDSEPSDSEWARRYEVNLPEPAPVVRTLPAWEELRPALPNPDAIEKVLGYMAERATAADVPEETRLAYASRVLDFSEAILKATSGGLRVKRGEKEPAPPPRPFAVDTSAFPLNRLTGK